MNSNEDKARRELPALVADLAGALAYLHSAAEHAKSLEDLQDSIQFGGKALEHWGKWLELAGGVIPEAE